MAALVSWSAEEIKEALAVFSEEVRQMARRYCGMLRSDSILRPLALSILLNSEAVSQETALTTEDIIMRSPLSGHRLLGDARKMATLKGAIANLAAADLAVKAPGTEKKYYSYRPPLNPGPTGEIPPNSNPGGHSSGAEVYRTKLNRILEQLQNRMISSKNLDVDLEGLESVLGQKLEELGTGLRGRTVALLGDTGTGKSWITNLLIMLSLVDRFTYGKINKDFDVETELEAINDLNDRRILAQDDDVIEMTLDDLNLAMENDELDTREEYRVIKDRLNGMGVNEDDVIKPFLLPSASRYDKAGHSTMAYTELAYGRRFHMLVEYHSEVDARNAARTYLHPAANENELELEASKARFDALFEPLEPLEEGEEPLVDELRLRNEVREILGKRVIYIGEGTELPADRRWLRSHLNLLMGHGPEDTKELYNCRSAAIKRIVIYLPSNLLAGGGRIIDPPGTNDRDPLNKFRLKEALNEANAVLVVTPNNLQINLCIDKLLESDCTFLDRLSHADSENRLIVIHYHEKNRVVGLKSVLNKMTKKLETDFISSLETGSRRGITSLISSYLDDKIEQAALTEDDFEDTKKRMLNRLSILTAYPTLFASLLLNREDAMEEIREEKSIYEESVTDAMCEEEYSQALEFTRGYQLLGLLEELGFKHCRAVGEATATEIEKSATAVVEQNTPPIALKVINSNTIIGDEDVDALQEMLRSPIEALIDSLPAMFNVDAMMAEAERRIEEKADIIARLPMRAINPLFQGRSQGTRGAFSLREALFKDAPVEAVFGRFYKELTDCLDQFFHSLAFAVTDILSSRGGLDDNARKWLESHAMPRSLRFLEAQKERFMSFKRCYFGREEWFRRQFNDAVDDVIAERLEGLCHYLEREGKGKRGEKGFMPSPVVGGKRKRPVKQTPLLGTAGYNGLQGLVAPIISTALRRTGETLSESIWSSAVALLRNFGPQNRPAASCQLALVFKMIRLITTEPGVVEDNLKENLRWSAEMIRALLAEREPDAATLGKAVGFNISRVAILEALYMCCNFFKINGELHMNRSEAIKILSHPQKPRKQPFVLSETVLSDKKGTTLKELKALLNVQSLELQDVPGDGNCFFHAMACNLWGETASKEQANNLRIGLCHQILRDHSTLEERRSFEARNGETVEAYVHRMSKDRTWADEIAIENFTHLFQRPIIVFQEGMGDPMIFGEGYTDDPLVIAHTRYNGDESGPCNHFQSVRSMNRLRERPQEQQSKPSRAPSVVLVVDTNAILRMNLFDFERFYDVIKKAKLGETSMIMVPDAVDEEVDRHKRESDSARRYYRFKDAKPKFREVFKDQRQVMNSSVDRSKRLELQSDHRSRNSKNDARIEHAVEHLLARGDSVILITGDTTIMNGCRSMVAAGGGQLRVLNHEVHNKYFEVLVRALRGDEQPQSSAMNIFTEEQRRLLRELRAGHSQLTIDILLKLFNP